MRLCNVCGRELEGDGSVNVTCPECIASRDAVVVDVPIANDAVAATIDEIRAALAESRQRIAVLEKQTREKRATKK
jgi:hypothetical protein